MIRPFLLSLGTSVGMAGLGFVTNVVLARVLAPDARGALAAVLLAAALIAGAAQLGLGPAFVYTVRSTAVPRPGRLAGLGAGVIAGLAALLGWGWHEVQFAGQAVAPPLALLVGCCTAQALHLYVSSLSQAQDGLHLFNRLRMVPTTLVFMGAVGTALAGVLQPDAATLLYTVGFSAAALLYLFSPAPIPAAADKPEATFHWPHHLRYSLQYHTTVLLGMLSTNIDKLYLSFSAPAASLGVYTVAYATSRLINVVQEAASNALFSRYAGRHSSDSGEMSDGVARVFRMTFYPMLLACGLIALVAYPLFGRVFGPAYQAGWLPFAVLLFECVIGGASWLLAQRFAAAGLTATVAARQVISLIPVVLALPLLRAEHLAVDMALAMLLSSTVRLLVTLHFLHRRAGLPPSRLRPRLADFDFLLTLPRGSRP